MTEGHVITRFTNGEPDEVKVFEYEKWYEVTAGSFSLIAYDTSCFPGVEERRQELVLFCQFTTDDGWKAMQTIPFAGENPIAQQTEFAIKKLGLDTVMDGYSWGVIEGERIRIRYASQGGFDFEIIPEEALS